MAMPYSENSNASTVPQKPIPSLAENLHSLAARLAAANDRLCSTVNRLIGSAPPEPAESAGNKQPDAQGALIVAQFGAERIRQQIEYIENQISRLEGSV